MLLWLDREHKSFFLDRVMHHVGSSNYPVGVEVNARGEKGEGSTAKVILGDERGELIGTDELSARDMLLEATGHHVQQGIRVVFQRFTF